MVAFRYAISLIGEMHESPLVSVVIPTWNRRELVQKAIASVFAQTYPNWELIVVDDGSTDGTVEELRELADSRLSVIAAPHAGSSAASRNRGIGQAKGEWITFLDSDDLWFPGKLELQLRALSESAAGWCYTAFELMDGEGFTIPMRAGGFEPLDGRIAEHLLLDRTAACIDTLLIRRGILDEIGGFDESLTFYEDLDFELRLAAAADAVALPLSLVRVLDHPGRKTAQMTHAHEHAAAVCERVLARRPEPNVQRAARRALARHLVGAAKARLSHREPLAAVKMLVRATARRR